ncbi:hypothetical protein [Streptomyces vastus]|uniref:hypothetical protein n=1 Tax=Streptomyces vastus TaxID=285451 RepID=UPI0031E36170
MSAEAAAAETAYEGTADLTHAVAAGVSGRELAATEFTEDVAIATKEDNSTVVPVRDPDGAFAPAEPAALTRPRRLQSSATPSSATRDGPPAPRHTGCCVR